MLYPQSPATEAVSAIGIVGRLVSKRKFWAAAGRASHVEQRATHATVDNESGLEDDAISRVGAPHVARPRHEGSIVRTNDDISSGL